MPTRETGFAICIENRGAEDLETRKVYRVLPDKAAAATGYVRVIDESVKTTSIPPTTSCAWICHRR